MAQQSSKNPSTFLLFPWGLLSILLILILNLALSDSWFGSNWSWITLVLIIPAAIFEMVCNVSAVTFETTYWSKCLCVH